MTIEDKTREVLSILKAQYEKPLEQYTEIKRILEETDDKMKQLYSEIHKNLTVLMSWEKADYVKKMTELRNSVIDRDTAIETNRLQNAIESGRGLPLLSLVTIHGTSTAPMTNKQAAEYIQLYNDAAIRDKQKELTLEDEIDLFGQSSEFLPDTQDETIIRALHNKYLETRRFYRAIEEESWDILEYAEKFTSPETKTEMGGKKLCDRIGLHYCIFKRITESQLFRRKLTVTGDGFLEGKDGEPFRTDVGDLVKDLVQYGAIPSRSYKWKDFSIPHSAYEQNLYISAIKEGWGGDPFFPIIKKAIEDCKEYGEITQDDLFG